MGAGGGLEVGTHGCAGIVNQSGGVMEVEGYNLFSVGGGIVGHFAGSGTYNLSAGTLNTGSTTVATRRSGLVAARAW